ncbi:epoxyqueuosine reductase QueH [bacterium]|nr:epoxyqueuosine reductase QueH [bacterium]
MNTPDTVRQKLLLHTCCGPCLTHPFQILKRRYEVVSFFYNPNIQPQTEFRKRLAETRKLSAEWDVPLVECTEDSDLWIQSTKGLEQEPEGGARCLVCYRMRLERTAREALSRGMDCFSTTLTLSPHKRADVIFPIGEEIGNRLGVVFLAEDFKKRDGFKASLAWSRDLGLYRQNYCGCLFSLREARMRLERKASQKPHPPSAGYPGKGSGSGIRGDV